MSHTAPHTVYPYDQAVLNACNSVFYWNEDVFGIQWSENMFKLDAEAKDAEVPVAGNDADSDEPDESKETANNNSNKESDNCSGENSSEGSEYEP